MKMGGLGQEALSCHGQGTWLLVVEANGSGFI